MSGKERIDVLVVKRELAGTRQRAQALIRAGLVLVNDTVVDKPGTRVADDAAVRLRGQGLRYVGRGGLKLEAGLKAFEIDPTGFACADLGASTGGFTDCLLQHGARRVFAIDVGYGQLAWSLRADPRVDVMERTNARHLEALDEPVDMVVGDLSFISITKVLPAMLRLARPGAQALLLIKPQFEVGRGFVGSGGVIRDDTLRAGAIQQVVDAMSAAGLTVLGHIRCPVAGAKKGNVEELVHATFPAAPLP